MLNKIFRRTSESFGLDIGSSAVKAVQIHESGGTRLVTGYATVPLPEGAIVDGAIAQRATVADAIKEAVAKAGIKGSDAVIGVSGRDLIIKKIEMPNVPPKERREVFLLEAEHQQPFALEEIYLDFHEITTRGDVIDALLVAVKKEKVNDYMAVVDQAGFAPTIVDVDGFAVGNQFEVNYPEEGREEAVALIDIGAAVMKTNVVRGGVTIFARDIPFGGRNYTEAIAQRLGVPFEQAEAAKLGKDVGVNWETLVPPLEAVSRDLSLEVQRTFDYFQSTAESERIGKIVLAGGCAQLPGLTEYLSSNWGIPVELARPFERIQVAPAYADEAAAVAPALAVAVGLGLRHPGDREQPK